VVSSDHDIYQAVRKAAGKLHRHVSRRLRKRS
jgi:hypothetical protein